MRKSTSQVADERRPLVSASHIIQAGSDLFIGKDEAYIMNRKKKEKSMLRKEGNAFVLDLFVRVPPSVTAPVTYTPMEVDAVNQVADGESEGSESRSVATAHLFDGRRSERGRQDRKCVSAAKNDENVSVLSATSDENGDELNGETDDEDMEDGEMGFDDGSVQVRNIRDPGQPTVKEHREHMTTHRPYRSW